MAATKAMIVARTPPTSTRLAAVVPMTLVVGPFADGGPVLLTGAPVVVVGVGEPDVEVVEEVEVVVVGVAVVGVDVAAVVVVVVEGVWTATGDGEGSWPRRYAEQGTNWPYMSYPVSGKVGRFSMFPSVALQSRKG